MKFLTAAAIGCLAYIAVAGSKADDGCVTTPGFAKPPCESARILKIRTVERAESEIGGPVAPAEEDETRPPRPISRPIYFISLECDGKVYVARVVGGTPGFIPDELAAAGSLRLRAADGKFFLKSEHGNEFEAILAAVPSPDSLPPR